MKIALEKNSKVLLAEIRQLDLEVFGSTDLSYNWYLENYNSIEEVVVARSNKKLAGYCLITGIDNLVFEGINAGVFSGDYSFSSRAYKPLKESNKYYLASIAVDKKYKGQGIGKELIGLSLTNLYKFNKQHEVVSIAVSLDGGKILGRNGFGRLLSLKTDGSERHIMLKR